MTRPLRIFIPGGYYHVTCRGNERRSIYRDDPDRTLFLEKLRGSMEKLYRHGQVESVGDWPGVGRVGQHDREVGKESGYGR